MIYWILNHKRTNVNSTNSKFFTYLVGVSGFLISSVAAWFSVTGIAQLFSGSFWSVVVMAGSLEFGKLVAASFIYRYWDVVNWLQKIYMTIAVVVLIGITSMGIFGFLSNSYMGATQEFNTMITKLEVYQEQLIMLEEDKEFLKDELEASVSSLPDNYITAKRKLRGEYNPQIQDKSLQIVDLKTKIGGIKIEMVDTGVDVGPLIYISETFGTDMDTAVKWIMFILILVFDPLAVLMIISFNMSLINDSSFKTKRKVNDIRNFIDKKVLGNNMTTQKDRALYSEPRGPLLRDDKPEVRIVEKTDGFDFLYKSKKKFFKNDFTSVKMKKIVKNILLKESSNLPEYSKSSIIYKPMIKFLLEKWKKYKKNSIKVPIT